MWAHRKLTKVKCFNLNVMREIFSCNHYVGSLKPAHICTSRDCFYERVYPSALNSSS